MAIAVASAQTNSSESLQQLVKDHRWDEIVRRIEATPERTADVDFYYGSALAHLGRLDRAADALRAGQHLAPRDPRFPTELGGIAFQKKNYAQAAKQLRRAVNLAPTDNYTNDFLGTVYFLEGNQQAAVKYWNRVDKPYVEQIQLEPVPRIAPALLDHAFAFAPASRLTAQQLLDSEMRVRALGVFAPFHFDLRALPDGRFDLGFRNQERNGLGDSKLDTAVVFLRDLPFQGVSPEYDNIAHQAINASALFRWDAQKRRIFAELSAPFEHRAKYRSVVQLDLRNENWALRNSFAGTAPIFASLNLRRDAGSVSIASYATDHLQWHAGAELSHRDERDAQLGTALTPGLLASGFQLKQTAALHSNLLRVPEHRFTVDAGASSQAARLWSTPTQSFEKLQVSAGWHWFPQAQGEDYEVRQQIRAGKTFGQIPFDELFMLGLERDNDLPMHAHIGTRDGRKGSSPLGRDYFLQNWEADKILYTNGLLTVKLGPLVDIGKITDPNPALGSHQWLFDLGAQVKLRVLSTTIAFSYGHDLRTGHNAFYVEPIH